ncbi:MAG: hypothetical protein KAQ92_05335, partial [Candidatus Aenigmarchaeota archaeon]|nr:hypothetical protein [Candidatus Aenigmarchaeota archaeon]
SELFSDVKIDIPELKVKTVFDSVNNSKLFADLKPQLKDFKSVMQSLKAEVLIKGELNKKITPKIKITLNKISTYYVPSKLPVAITGGKINLDTEKVELKDIAVKVLNSPINISGELTDIAVNPQININADGKISTKIFPKEIQKSLKVKGNLPVTAQLIGNDKNWNLIAQTNIDNFLQTVKFNQPKNTSNILNINAKGDNYSVKLTETGLFSGLNIPKNKSGLYNLASTSKLISIEGTVHRYNKQNPLLDDIKINISDLKLSLDEEKTKKKNKIQINGNLVLNGKADAPKILGALNFKNIDIPSILFKADNINIDLKDKEILVNTGNLNLADFGIKLVCVMESKLSPPFKVRTMEISSDFLNIDKLSKVLQPMPQKKK